MNTTPLEPPEPASPASPTTPLAAESGSGAAPPTAEPQTPEAPLAPGKRSGASTGTIVWGVLVLAFCAGVLQQTVAPGTVDPGVWITGVILGLGALLLVVAVAVILRGRR
ncbi:hypothetical protein GCM10009847_12510 [Leucobacter tardus]|uniref:Uncharacterized protein n=1 Tax=Leucobacter tardus TaxID=501483 RepID=A0A939TQX5_9MICO|nr:hypothetical protein [Leucobacter tardus]MBO2989442.1 hypothetical protein [Leucobacter tardus]